MAIVTRFVPHALAVDYEAGGWTLAEIIGGNHGAHSVLAFFIDPGWRDMVRPAKRIRVDRAHP